MGRGEAGGLSVRAGDVMLATHAGSNGWTFTRLDALLRKSQ